MPSSRTSRYARANARGVEAIETVEEYSGKPAELSVADLLALRRPVVIRGVAADWPAVRAPDKAAYLKRFDSGAMTDMSVGAPEHKGRLFYAAGLDGLNFTKRPATVSEVLDRLVATASAGEPETIAAQAVQIGRGAARLRARRTASSS